MRLFVQCSRFYSGRCDVTWAARVRSSWAKRSDGSSSKRAATHMQRELNRRGWPQGEKAIERLHGKNVNIPPIALRSRNWLSNTFFVLFSFVILRRRIQEFSALKLSFALLDFFLILPDFSILHCSLLEPLYPVNCFFFPTLDLDITLFWTFYLSRFFLKFQHKIS